MTRTPPRRPAHPALLSLGLALVAACGPDDLLERKATSSAFAPQAAPYSPGSGLRTGVVSGRIYADLADHATERLRDLSALGARLLRVEIEHTTPWRDYRAIQRAARHAGIDLLALFSINSLWRDWALGRATASSGALPETGGSRHPYDPLAPSREEYVNQYLPRAIQAFDRLLAELPGLAFVELWNEPEGFGFAPLATGEITCRKVIGGTCVLWRNTCRPQEGAYRYALLVARLYEHVHQKRLRGEATPQLAAFDFSRLDNRCWRSAVFNAEPIGNHRGSYRPAHGLADGLPTDIVSIHAYGNTARAPWEPGYQFKASTLEDGLADFLRARFADGRPAIGDRPVWITEVGYGLNTFTREERGDLQARALRHAFQTFARYPSVTAAFWYSYRDDEAGPGSEGHRYGLRYNSARGFAPHEETYRAFQEVSGITSAAR
ncbi:MAG: hypothetical protein IT371_09280 [Deltaproteobacteria bacterium]|nr:hypothetical protein [Deltaproteobacteria bacterium]